MQTPHKKKSDKIRKKIEDGCKSCNCPSLKCAYNEIERAEIRMGPNDRRNRIIELLSFRRHETLDNLAHEFGVSRYPLPQTEDCLGTSASARMLVMPGNAAF